MTTKDRQGRTREARQQSTDGWWTSDGWLDLDGDQRGEVGGERASSTSHLHQFGRISVTQGAVRGERKGIGGAAV